MLWFGHNRQLANVLWVCARTVKAGDNIEVLKQHLPDGWSLVSAAGQVGLVPESYYTVSGDRVLLLCTSQMTFFRHCYNPRGIFMRIWSILVHFASPSPPSTLQDPNGVIMARVVHWWFCRIRDTKCYL